VEAFNVGGLNVGTFNIKGTIIAVISNLKSWSEFMDLFYVESQAALNIGPSKPLSQIVFDIPGSLKTLG